MTPALEARNLNTYYGQSHILRGVSFRVMPRETVSLLGRNGMGKTTLLRTLIGLVRPRSGEIFLNGEAVTATRASARARRASRSCRRTAASFPISPWRRTSRSPRVPAAPAGSGRASASTACSRASPSAAASGGTSFRAASSRC